MFHTLPWPLSSSLMDFLNVFAANEIVENKSFAFQLFPNLFTYIAILLFFHLCWSSPCDWKHTQLHLKQWIQHSHSSSCRHKNLHIHRLYGGAPLFAHETHKIYIFIVWISGILQRQPIPLYFCLFRCRRCNR